MTRICGERKEGLQGEALKIVFMICDVWEVRRYGPQLRRSGEIWKQGTENGRAKRI